MKLKLKKNDTVIVVKGKERFAHKTGKVLKIFQESGRVVVQGVNFVKRHTRPSAKNQQGGILEKEAPLSLSNVMLYCPRCKKGTRVGIKVLADKGKVRFCRRCQETLDKS
ncbi:MAG: 50S ribosomal protein L24 [Candidatus Aureabacteria bacterium]|nr:50S ribosomal protein L24 [Candidatus Auribacterota bacterium]